MSRDGLLKVVTFVGTRPEIIRLSRVIPLLDARCDHVLVHTGQNYDYELNEIFFTDLSIRKPNYFLDAAGSSSAETIGNVIAKADQLLRVVLPDAVLILGDTNSALAAIAAKRLRIPIFHMEAGNRCFDQRVPEEINRKIVDHISDINLTYSSIARENLLREGLQVDMVIKTGSPMLEVLTHYQDRINESNVLSQFGLLPHEYFIVSSHREENVDRKEGRNHGRPCRALWFSSDNVDPPENAEAYRRVGDCFSSLCTTHQAVRVQRLYRTSTLGLRGSVRQRNYHRGIGDPELSCGQPARDA